MTFLSSHWRLLGFALIVLGLGGALTWEKWKTSQLAAWVEAAEIRVTAQEKVIAGLGLALERERAAVVERASRVNAAEAAHDEFQKTLEDPACDYDAVAGDLYERLCGGAGGGS